MRDKLAKNSKYEVRTLFQKIGEEPTVKIISNADEPYTMDTFPFSSLMRFYYMLKWKGNIKKEATIEFYVVNRETNKRHRFVILEAIATEKTLEEYIEDVAEEFRKIERDKIACDKTIVFRE